MNDDPMQRCQFDDSTKAGLIVAASLDEILSFLSFWMKNHLPNGSTGFTFLHCFLNTPSLDLLEIINGSAEPPPSK